MTEEELAKIEEDSKKQDDFVFIREEIKSRPVNKKKLVRNTLVAAVSAVVFGLVACITFAILAPFVMNRISDEKEERPENEKNPILVSFPEETIDEEMNPEDMLLTTPDPEPDLSQFTLLEEEEIQAIIASARFSMNDYEKLYASLSQIAITSARSLVCVSPVKRTTDWLSSTYVNDSKLSGVILEENGSEWFVLTRYSEVKNCELIVVAFFNGTQAQAELVGYDSELDLCILSIPVESISDITKEAIQMPVLGSSTYYNIVGAPCIAIGSPLGGYKSMNYGIVSSNSTKRYATDFQYKELITNMYGDKDASGVIINIKGEIIGIIDDSYEPDEYGNIIRAIGITELKKVLERLINGQKTVLFGITGDDVPGSLISENAPEGVFVTSVSMNSPAMKAGIQSGDIITGIGEVKVSKFTDLINEIRVAEIGQEADLVIYRKSQDEYKRIDLVISFDKERK